MEGEGEKKLLAEALLYASDKPLDIKTLQRALKIRSPAKVRKILEELVREYHGRAVEVVELEGGRFYMRLRPDLVQFAKKFSRHRALPHGILKTLATIAYYQPIPVSSLAAIRGKDVYRQLKVLVEKGLVEGEKSGRTKVLRTTQLFADLFGVENNPSAVRNLVAKMVKEVGEPNAGTTTIPETGLKPASNKSLENGSVAHKHP
jgi:segregation and condensation protein B